MLGVERQFIEIYVATSHTLVNLYSHTFPVGEMQLRVAEFCYCFAHSFNFHFVAQKSPRVGQVLEKYEYRIVTPVGHFITLSLVKTLNISYV